MQADQTLISLRPGGGGGCSRGTRFLTPRFDSSSSSVSSDSQTLRPNGSFATTFKTGDVLFEGSECVRYTPDQLLQLKEVQCQSQNCYSEPDNRDWHTRSATSGEEKDFSKAQEFSAREDQLNSEFASVQISDNQGVGCHAPHLGPL